MDCLIFVVTGRGGGWVAADWTIRLRRWSQRRSWSASGASPTRPSLAWLERAGDQVEGFEKSGLLGRRLAPGPDRRHRAYQAVPSVRVETTSAC